MWVAKEEPRSTKKMSIKEILQSSALIDIQCPVQLKQPTTVNGELAGLSVIACCSAPSNWDHSGIAWSLNLITGIQVQPMGKKRYRVII